MSTGSKVVLLLTFLFIGVLIWYYGPESDSPERVATDPVLAIDAETTVTPSIPATPAIRSAKSAASTDPPAVPSISRTAKAPSPPAWSPPTFRAAAPASSTPSPAASSRAGTLVMGRPLTTPSPQPPREAAQTATRTRAVASPPKAAPRSYVVVEGDTLSGIAVMYYGTETGWARIAEANPDVDPDRLRIGATLRIPAHSPRPPRQSTRTITAATVNGKNHLVEEGDSLSSIAVRYYGRDSRWSKIFEANRTLLQNDPDRLQIGMVLAIPSK